VNLSWSSLFVTFITSRIFHSSTGILPRISPFNVTQKNSKWD
jgi:hypothetical protein